MGRALSDSIGALPLFPGERMQLAPSQFFWFLMLSVGGILGCV